MFPQPRRDLLCLRLAKSRKQDDHNEFEQWPCKEVVTVQGLLGEIEKSSIGRLLPEPQITILQKYDTQVSCLVLK